jgi:diguanylate cyclase (GGDEF)-like protein
MPMQQQTKEVGMSEQRRWIAPRTLLVLLVAAVLAAGTALLGYGEQGRHGPVDLGLPAWALVPAFFAAEVWAVHLHVRGRQAQSFTLSEVPLVVGLFACAPLALLAARLVGGGAALIQGGRQSPIKLIYNLACFAFETMLAIVLFGLLVADRAPLDPAGWLAATGAVALAGTASVVLVVLAVTLTDETPGIATIGKHLLAGLTVGVTNTSLALLAVLAAQSNRAGVLLVVIPALVLFVAYRAHHTNRRRTGSLGLLHETNRLLQAANDRTAAVEALLRRLADVFGVERVELLLLGRSAEEPGALFSYRVGVLEGPDPIADVDECPWWSTLSHVAGPVLLPQRPRSVYGLVEGLPEGTKEAMLAPLSGESGWIGGLMVADRALDAVTFEEEDLSLLVSLVDVVAAYCENDRLERTLRHVHDLSAELEYRANHDPLTGLGNRALFRRHLDEAVGGPDRRWTVLLLDLDDFKDVNDSLGHDAGDVLLIEVARRLRRALPGEALATRLGGDEFAVLLPAGPAALTPAQREARARAAAEQLLAALALPVLIAGREVPIGSSIGAAVDEPGMEPGELVQQADVAMYQAKMNGKNAVEVFRPELLAAVQSRLDLGSHLRTAVERGEIDVHYQPTFEVATGRCVGVEALARWDHPTRDRIDPVDFIPLAEETGQIVELGRHVMRTAVFQARAWQLAYHPTLVIAVNVSLRQLAEASFVDEVGRLLDESGLEPATLLLEVTESLLLADDPFVSSALDRLKQLGVRLAIDDFGTGYSSLSYLARLPVDVLKLDRSFIDGIDTDPRQALLSRTVVELGRGLGLQVVAEGVERPGQCARLLAWGCPVGQGFYFARPGPAEQIVALLAEAGVRPAVSTAAGITQPDVPEPRGYAAPASSRRPML